MLIDEQLLAQARAEMEATNSESNRNVRDPVISPFAGAMRLSGYRAITQAGCSILRECPACKNKYSTKYVKDDALVWACPHCKLITSAYGVPEKLQAAASLVVLTWASANTANLVNAMGSSVPAMVAALTACNHSHINTTKQMLPATTAKAIECVVGHWDSFVKGIPDTVAPLAESLSALRLELSDQENAAGC